MAAIPQALISKPLMPVGVLLRYLRQTGPLLLLIAGLFAGVLSATADVTIGKGDDPKKKGKKGKENDENLIPVANGRTAAFYAGQSTVLELDASVGSTRHVYFVIRDLPQH